MKTRADFGKFLQKHREDAGVTQKQLADKLGYSTAQFVSNIECGLALIPVMVIRRWARTIEVRANEILEFRANVIIAEQNEQFEGARA
jgi:transcriptional regulator with XRE-family HTH domain